MKPVAQKLLPEKLIQVGSISVDKDQILVYHNLKFLHLRTRYYSKIDNKWFSLEDDDISRIKFNIERKKLGDRYAKNNVSKVIAIEIIRKKLGLKY